MQQGKSKYEVAVEIVNSLINEQVLSKVADDKKGIVERHEKILEYYLKQLEKVLKTLDKS